MHHITLISADNVAVNKLKQRLHSHVLAVLVISTVLLHISLMAINVRTPPHAYTTDGWLVRMKWCLQHKLGYITPLGL